MLETILQPGQTVAGKYCLNRRLSTMGTAVVWEGVNLRTGRGVALKVVHLDAFASPVQREARTRGILTASRILHPNLVSVHEVLDVAGRIFIVMELLGGVPLNVYLTRKRILAMDEAIGLLLPAMQGIAAANARGLFHVALNPSQLFVCASSDGRPFTTKVLNLGTSLSVDADRQKPRTGPTSLSESPERYLSPEQVVGGGSIDERANVYNFGAILYEALAGQPPFMGATGSDLLKRIITDPLPKLSGIRPDLSPDVDGIIEKAMAKSPGDRFPSLEHFITAVMWEQVLPSSPMLRAMTPESGSVPDPIRRGPEVRGSTSPAASQGHPSDGSVREPFPSERPKDWDTPPFGFRSAPVVNKQKTTQEQPMRVSSHPAPISVAAPTLDETDLYLRGLERRTRRWQVFFVFSLVGLAAAVVTWFKIPNRTVPAQEQRQQDPAPALVASPPDSGMQPSEVTWPDGGSDTRMGQTTIPEEPMFQARRTMKGKARAAEALPANGEPETEKGIGKDVSPSSPSPAKPLPAQPTIRRPDQLSPDDF